MRLLSMETGYRDTEGLSYLTDYTDVHGLNSVKIPAYRQAGATSVRNSYAEWRTETRTEFRCIGTTKA